MVYLLCGISDHSFIYLFFNQIFYINMFISMLVLNFDTDQNQFTYYIVIAPD